MKNYKLTPLDEGERRIVLLALLKLRAERPGWAATIGVIEEKLGGQLPWPDSSRERYPVSGAPDRRTCGHHGLRYDCPECRMVLEAMGLVDKA